MENKEFDTLLIQQYLAGKLDAKRMHELEKQALEEPFLADALEGYAHANKPIEQQLSILQRQLQDRIAISQENKNQFNFAWQRLSVAAAAGLMFITIGILFWMNNKNNQSVAENQKESGVEVNSKSIALDNKSKEQIIALQSADSTANTSEERLAGSSAKAEGSSKSLMLDNKSNEQMAVLRPANKTASTPAGGLAGPSVNTSARKPVISPALKTPDNSVAQAAAFSGLNISDNATGKVISEAGQAMPGAGVRVKGSDIRVITNAQGEFTLPDTVKGTIAVTFVGFETKEVAFNSGDKLAVVLNPDKTSLEEVVVLGYGTQTKGTVTGAVRQTTDSSVPAVKAEEKLPNANPEPGPTAMALIGAAAPKPLNGWQKYQEYLEQNTRSPRLKTPGTVIVGFDIQPNGELSNIHIVRGLNRLCDAEAIRVVKKGPKWEPVLSRGTSKATVTVTFKSN